MRTLLLSLLLCSSSLGQDVVVGPDNIKVGTALTCPRFSTLYPGANNLIVAAETTQTLPATFDFDVIEVSGTLKLSRTYDTAGKFIVIQVLPGGSLDFGSASDPVLRKVDLQIKDSPLLTGTDGALGPDPEQFGSGILIFGEWKSYGRALNKTWTTMQPVAAGATTLTLTDTVNWQVGDDLLIPDTRQVRKRNFSVSVDPNYTPIRRESPVKIAAINSNVVTLSKPLDFEHSAAAGQLPYVANCTRNIVIRSENPNGVRGHAMFMGTAHVNLYYTAFLDLGRTRAEPLDSFNSNSQHVGTNQIARYGGPHWHHVHGHADAQQLTGRLIGCYGNGGDATKWFAVQHGTHDLLLSDNVVERFVGACFTTEDGNEVRGQYLRNFAAHATGNGLDGKSNIINNSPGSDGAAFWWHGSMHTLRYNVAVANATGLSVVHRNQVVRPYPSIPGGENDTPFDPSLAVPISFGGNVFLSNIDHGVELWQIPTVDWVVADSQILHSGFMGVFMGAGEPCRATVRGCDLINTNGYYQGIHSSAGYTTELIVEDTSIEGFSQGLQDVAASAIHRKLSSQSIQGFLMSLSPTQQQTLKADIAAKMQAGQPLAAYAGSSPGDPDANTFIANYYKQLASPQYNVWKSSISRSDIYHKQSAEGTTWDWSTYKGQSQGEQGAWVQMFMGDAGPIGNLNFRAGIFSIFSGSGAQATQRAHCFAAGKRAATIIEKLLAVAVVGGSTNTGNDTNQARGSLANPDNLGFEGVLTILDIEQARSAA